MVPWSAHTESGNWWVLARGVANSSHLKPLKQHHLVHALLPQYSEGKREWVHSPNHSRASGKTTSHTDERASMVSRATRWVCLIHSISLTLTWLGHCRLSFSNTASALFLATWLCSWPESMRWLQYVCTKYLLSKRPFVWCSGCRLELPRRTNYLLTFSPRFSLSWLAM